MQNRYVGDIGDYVKLAILRALMPGHQLGVAWWLYEDEDHNNNGRHVSYLENPTRWRHYDPDLYDGLKRIVDSGIRNVAELERANFLPGAVFANELIPVIGSPAQRRKNRVEWFERAKILCGQCDLLFIDPDNGLETSNFSAGAKAAGKSVSLVELIDLARQGRTIVVYHHQTRRKGGHTEEIKFWAARLRDKGFRTVDALRSPRYSPRVFFLLNAAADIRDRAERLTHRWPDLLSWHAHVSNDVAND